MNEVNLNNLIQISTSYAGNYCEKDAHGYCPTCADEALPARVLEIDDSKFTAKVEIDGQTMEIDISLIDEVALNEVLLVHGGVAIGSLSEELRS